ncbi:acyl-CoA dehydrogenase family protein [Allosediminivita pacifica]|uniref:(2S)-methylsuccinyl-CoA dehydrogenase n=1 Tax=Allosediminivita pacifica TaxID=1267769 RepID=A0A2T6AXD9_9RHOB|nr:acyl-CoA dehydrogenase family protein [Allosediminivita pacifica]PTX48484.1 (2S)-methylsuccinyl-CoA dehydrogenase [Allosediminivita pacifica]GGB10169.1 (2S)-methylsuccinyl-CoA dehydrogenase [Allosediminivita pacifica]
MAHDGQDRTLADEAILPGLTGLTAAALDPAGAILETARTRVRDQVIDGDRVSAALVEARQTATHGLAWLATYVESLRQMQGWAERLEAEGCFGEVEQLLLQIAFGEYLWQIYGGIQMNQGEVVRLQDLGLSQDEMRDLMTPEVTTLCERGNTQEARLRLVALMQERSAETTVGRTGLGEELDMIRDQFRRYAADRIEPHAHDWHLKDELIPMEVIEELSEMGVFGLTIPEEYGGLGMPKASMCVVSEELSRGYIGVGSLGTRSEIAAELVLAGGTDDQKAHWLPRLASGEVLPTAVFTEPNTGSDLGSLRTKARKDDNGDWILNGNKTWITHAARTHVMTVLARSVEGTDNYKGLSMFLAEKTPGTDEKPFVDPGISGGEIEVLGYRGMKEYTVNFDDFRVKGGNLLGQEEGHGFKQLMETFESARIQTAARAIGVGQSALDVSMRYAQDRKQFGKPLIAFPRVASKLAMMAVELMVARQLTYHSASEKDAGRRCDLEAGMAKLLGARVAWAAADNGLQIHGGNGFALEYTISRILCDARILNIFEGAAEIQAQVIARRLLG